MNTEPSVVWLMVLAIRLILRKFPETVSLRAQGTLPRGGGCLGGICVFSGFLSGICVFSRRKVGARIQKKARRRRRPKRQFCEPNGVEFVFLSILCNVIQFCRLPFRAPPARSELTHISLYSMAQFPIVLKYICDSVRRTQSIDMNIQ